MMTSALMNLLTNEEAYALKQEIYLENQIKNWGLMNLESNEERAQRKEDEYVDAWEARQGGLLNLLTNEEIYQKKEDAYVAEQIKNWGLMNLESNEERAQRKEDAYVASWEARQGGLQNLVANMKAQDILRMLLWISVRHIKWKLIILLNLIYF